MRAFSFLHPLRPALSGVGIHVPFRGVIVSLGMVGGRTNMGLSILAAMRNGASNVNSPAKRISR